MCGYFVAADTQQGFRALELNTYLLLKKLLEPSETALCPSKVSTGWIYLLQSLQETISIVLKVSPHKTLGVHHLIKEIVNVLWPGVELIYRQTLGTRGGLGSVYGLSAWIIQSRLDELPSKHRCRISYQRTLTRCFGPACDTAPHERWMWNKGNVYKDGLMPLHMHPAPRHTYRMGAWSWR